MAYVRYFRRVQLAPGIRLNLSKSGPSVSFGVRGAHLTVGRRGITRTLGLPGTGLYYTSPAGRHTGAHTAPQFEQAGGKPLRPQHAAAGCLLLAGVALIALVIFNLLIG